MYEYLQIGKINNTHGVAGMVKVIPLTDDPNRFKKLKRVYVGNDTVQKEYNIEEVKFFKNLVLVKFKEVNDMNEAESLKNSFILIDRKNAVKLPKDSFFICDLIGCEVYEESGNKLGSHTDVLQTGSNDVYVVKDETGKEKLLPAIKSVVTNISIEDRMITVKLPKEYNESDK